MAKKLELNEIEKVTGGVSIHQVGTFYFVIEYNEHGTGELKTYTSKDYSDEDECLDAMFTKINQIESDGSWVLTQNHYQN